MKLKVFGTDGAQLREIEAADEVFGIEPHAAVLHQAYVAQMANRRAGSASTLRRGEVAGSTRKVRRQKGLGAARQGSSRASHRVGGGVAHGPRPHSFARAMPKQMRRLALRSALSTRAASGDIVVVEGLAPEEPKTRAVQQAFSALGLQGRTLVVSGEHEANLMRATRNLAGAKTVPASCLNVVDILNARRVLMSEDAVRKVESLWGGEDLKPSRGRRGVEE